MLVVFGPREFEEAMEEEKQRRHAEEVKALIRRDGGDNIAGCNCDKLRKRRGVIHKERN